MANNERKPGDLFLDRYLADADEETRELARERLREYVLHLVDIGDRIQRRRAKALDVPENANDRTMDENNEEFDTERSKPGFGA